MKKNRHGILQMPIRRPKKVPTVEIDYWDRLRETVYSRSQHCYYCGRYLLFLEFTVDHICPRALGGRDHLDNLATCCEKCNNLKGQLTLEEFRIAFENFYNRNLFYYEQEKLTELGQSPK